jgi:hypothetical protein
MSGTFEFELTAGGVRQSLRPNSIFLIKDVIAKFPDDALNGPGGGSPITVVLGNGVSFPTLIDPAKKNIRSGRTESQKWLADIGAKAGDRIVVTDLGGRTYSFDLKPV